MSPDRQLIPLDPESLGQIAELNYTSGYLSWEEFCKIAGIEDNSAFTSDYLKAEDTLTTIFGRKPDEEHRRKGKISWRIEYGLEKYDVVLIWSQKGRAHEVGVSVSEIIEKPPDNPRQPKLF